MLQRQIMLKQLQELQRRGQLQELGDAREQNYINPLSPLKQASGGQFPPTANGTPVLDSSQMFMVGNMRMMQHGGSGGFVRSPNGLVLSQSQNLGVGHMGISQPQLDMYLYGAPATNSDRDLNNNPHLQGSTTDLLSKNHNISLGRPSLHPSTFGNAFISQHCNVSSDQISAPDGSLPNQFFQEKNLFQQIPLQSIDGENLAGSYPEQGNTTPSKALTLDTEGRCEDSGWHGLSTRKGSNLGQSLLDPLEQKILYNADDHTWESSFSRSSNIGTGGFIAEKTSFMDALSSTQSGSWSALMQSAVAETSSSDTGMQEEWSGLSFQNPGPSADNQPTNFFDNDKQHTDWVDANSPNVVSPRFKLENLNQNSDRNSSYPGFQQSDHQHHREQKEFRSASSHTSNQMSSTYTSQLADYSSQLKRLTEVSNLIQTPLPFSNIWPGQHKEHTTSDEDQSHILLHANDNQANDDFSGQDLRGTSWLDGSASYPVSGSVQKPFDDVTQLDIPSFPIASEKTVPGHNVEPLSSFLSSPGFYSQSAAAQSENMLGLLNEDGISDYQTHGVHLSSKASNPNESSLTETSAATFSISCNTSPVSQDFDFRPCPKVPWTPQHCSFFPSLSTGNSTATSSAHTAKNNVKNQNPTPPLRSNMVTNFPTLSAADVQEYSHLKIARSDEREFPLLDNIPVSENFVASTPKTSYYSSSLFRCLDSVSSSQENSSEVLNDQPYLSSCKHENNKQDLLPSSKDYEQQLEKQSSLHQGLLRINNSMPLSSSSGKQEILRNQFLEADAVSGPLVTHTYQQTSNQASHVDKQTLTAPVRDVRGLGSNQNFSLPHPMHPPINADTENDLSLPLKYDNAYYQQAAKVDLNFVSQLGASFTGDNKGSNLLPEVQGHLLGEASTSTHHQNFQRMEAFGQNSTQRQAIGGREASCVTYGSQINLQMAPTWFKHYGTLKNEQRLPVYGPNTSFNVQKPLTGMTVGNLQESSLMMPANSVNPSQGTCVWPSTDINLTVRKQLSSPIVLPSDVIHQNLLVSMPKKRKIVDAFDLVSWHKEVNHERSRLQDISSTPELEWSQASNRRLEEVKNDVEIVEDVLPLVPAKRRLIFTTQLMQKVFKPAPAAILCADASSNYDCVVYSAARFALGDVCGLIGHFSSEADVMSRDEQKTSKKTNVHGFTQVVEGLICRVNKLDGDLSRLHKTSLFADIKVENQELEKISIINRFAKFHIKAQSSATGPATSSGKSNIQRYVMALPMPRTIPEGIDCLSL